MLYVVFSHAKWCWIWFVVVSGLCAHGNGRTAAAASATHQQSHAAYVTDRFHKTILAVHLSVPVNPHTPSDTPLHSIHIVTMSPSLPCDCLFPEKAERKS